MLLYFTKGHDHLANLCAPVSKSGSHGLSVNALCQHIAKKRNRMLRTSGTYASTSSYLFLNAASGDESIDIDLLLLPITPHPCSCLLVCGRIPVCSSMHKITVAKLH